MALVGGDSLFNLDDVHIFIYTINLFRIQI